MTDRATAPEPTAPPPRGFPISEDWLATLVGLALLLLVLAGVIRAGVIP